MPVAIRAATRIQDMDDANVSLGVGVDEYTLVYDHDTAKFVLRQVFPGSSGNTIWGHEAAPITTATDLTAFGFHAAKNTTNPASITAIGYLALEANTTGHANTAVGGLALTSVVTGAGNDAFGWHALQYATGDHNDAFGTHALTGVVGVSTGSSNVAMGYSALTGNTTGSNNVAVGCQALFSAATVSGQTAVGFQALYNSIAANNTAVGYQAGIANTIGTNLTALGNRALFANLDANSNTAVGASCLVAATSGGENAGLGAAALSAVTTGSRHTAVGVYAGAAETTNSRGVFIGYGAGFYETGSDKLFIDNATRASEADGRLKALIYGVFDPAVANQYLTVNGQLQVSGTGNHYIQGFLGVGTATPLRTLHVYYPTATAEYSQIYVEGAQGGWGAGITFASKLNYSPYTVTAQAKIVADGTGSWGSAGQVSSKLTFWTVNANSLTEKMVIDAAGNIGISDTSPAEKLDVTGNANVTGVYKVDDVQVISNRVIDARCADIANSGDATTDGLIDALRDAMITHGLIAAA